jgi:hypothetical protein
VRIVRVIRSAKDRSAKLDRVELGVLQPDGDSKSGSIRT